MSKLATLYCSDEDLCVRLGGDFVLLAPKWQALASGNDGAVAALTPWTLGSAGASFTASTIGPGSVVWLTAPAANFRGSGELFGVDSITATTIVLHRIGLGAGAGKPPTAGAAVTSIAYAVLTLTPQIEEASFDLNRRYRIDPSWPGREPSDAYDLRDLRQACVLTVIVQRLQAEVQDKRDAAWGLKLQTFRQELGEVLARLTLRWTQDDRRQPTNWFSTRIVR